MFLIVGLGNPGAEYDGTRHNVGFEVVELLAERSGARFSDRKFKGRLARARVGGEECWLLMPQTYMNLSGESVGPAAGFYKLDTAHVIVVHDDVDLPVGRLKLKKGGGHGGHNGLRSLMAHLPNAEFIRMRFGVGRPPPRWDTADFVLSRFEPDEREQIDEAVKKAAKAIATVVRHGLSRAMNDINRSPDQKSGGRKEKKKEDTSGEDSAPRTGAGEN